MTAAISSTVRPGLDTTPLSRIRSFCDAKTYDRFSSFEPRTPQSNVGSDNALPLTGSLVPTLVIHSCQQKARRAKSECNDAMADINSSPSDREGKCQEQVTCQPSGNPHQLVTRRLRGFEHGHLSRRVVGIGRTTSRPMPTLHTVIRPRRQRANTADYQSERHSLVPNFVPSWIDRGSKGQ